MEIYLSRYAGFCSGVARAYQLVSSLNMNSAKSPVYILGHLVHNEDVVKKVKEKGIREISRKEFFNDQSKKIGTLIITAHGVEPNIYQLAKKRKIEVLDTTCPKVIKVQKLAQSFAKRNYEIVLVGDKNHNEVEGINAWGNGKAKIISSEDDFGKIKFLEDKKIVVLSQTTQSEDFFQKVAQLVKQEFPQARILSTLCDATHKRQEEIKKLARKSDVVIIIGSKTSANSRRLFEIASLINSQSYFISNAQGINKRWFSQAKKITVTAGASTPDWIIKDVINKLKQIK